MRFVQFSGNKGLLQCRFLYFRGKYNGRGAEKQARFFMGDKQNFLLFLAFLGGLLYDKTI